MTSPVLRKWLAMPCAFGDGVRCPSFLHALGLARPVRLCFPCFIRGRELRRRLVLALLCFGLAAVVVALARVFA
jgi:hypothetical protein